MVGGGGNGFQVENINWRLKTKNTSFLFIFSMFYIKNREFDYFDFCVKNWIACKMYEKSILINEFLCNLSFKSFIAVIKMI